MARGFLGLDVELRAHMKVGKDSLRNAGDAGRSPGRSAHLEESTNRKIQERPWWEEVESWYESGVRRAKFGTAFKQRKLR